MKLSGSRPLRGPAPAIPLLLCVVVLVLAACGGSVKPAPSAAAPTVAAPTAAATMPATQAPPTQMAEPTKTAAPTLTQAPTATSGPAATQAPVAAVSTDAANCVKCHTDQVTLQKLAKELPPAEKLSEGEG